jgi:hypothetical protein
MYGTYGIAVECMGGRYGVKEIFEMYGIYGKYGK